MFNNDKDLEAMMKQCTGEANNEGNDVDFREEQRKLAQWLLELTILRKKYKEE